MHTEEITSQVDRDAAEAYRAATPEERRKLICADVREAHQEFAAGQCRPVSVVELMNEILSQSSDHSSHPLD